jgi:hypothetical protein
MKALVIVAGDRVEGTDRHNVSGLGPNPAAPPPAASYTGTGDYDYVGAMTGALSDFVKIAGKPVALTSSRSALDPAERVPPAGRHSGPAGTSFAPGPGTVAQTPTPITLAITDAIGEGRPAATAGSALVSVGGVPVLRDGDAIDTCDGLGTPMNSTVSAGEQDFVSCGA